MKGFDRCQFDAGQCRQELLELKELLESSDNLREKKHILPFFRSHRNVSLFVGAFNANLVDYDLLAFEFDVFGDFVADIVIGDSERCKFNFVEIEDAGPNSLQARRPQQERRL